MHSGIRTPLVLILAMGCADAAPKPPPLHPVRGKIPLQGGLVQFTPTAGVPLTITAEVQPDGTFEAMTVFDGRRLPGVPEGSYQVTVVPAGDPRQATAIVLPRPVQIKPEPNNLVLPLPPRR